MKPRRTTSIDLRERILSVYDEGEQSRKEVADRFRVSLGMVKKLIQQRRKIGSIAPLHHLAGRKPEILETHREEMKRLLAQKVDMTLAEIRTALGLDCTVQAIHIVLGKMGLTYKKRRSEPANKTVLTSPRHARSGKSNKRDWTPRG